MFQTLDVFNVIKILDEVIMFEKFFMFFCFCIPHDECKKMIMCNVLKSRHSLEVVQFGLDQI